MKREYSLIVNLKDTVWKDVFKRTYRTHLREDFVWLKDPKKHTFTNHVHGFIRQLQLNFANVEKEDLKKWQLCLVDYTMNTWSEISFLRPSIIYKADTTWQDVIVLPLTSWWEEKLIDRFDVPVPKDLDNKLYQNSYARLRQLRAISIKKIGAVLWEITNPNTKEAIDKAVKEMLGITL